MRDIEKLYSDLYDAANVESGYRLNKNRCYFNELSHFVGMKGSKFDEQGVRLLIVGRAVNGWGTIAAASAECFAQQAVSQMEDHFKWVHFDNGSLRNDDKDGNWYWLSKSPFWRVSKQIWMAISDNTVFVDQEDDRWVDHIAWTNLYKIAPKETGNPTTTMCNKQLGVCKEILLAEIAHYKPTHILLVTGYRYWFDAFEDIFTGSTQPVKLISGHAETTFCHNDIKIVVACRPERKNEQQYVEDVLSAFGALNDV